MSWVTRPLIAVDCETTGLDVETDRVVTCCVGVSVEPGDWKPWTWLINPGAPIPAEATAVHGVTDDMAAKGQDLAGALDLIRNRLEIAAIRGLPIVGHNLAFDLSLLDREFRRYLDKPLPEGLIALDTLVLFRRFDFTTGSRSLESLAFRHDITFPAHDAEQDALASLRLLHILANDNDLLPHVDPATLHELQKGWHEAQTLSAHYQRLGRGKAPGNLPDTSWPLIPFPTDSRPTVNPDRSAVEGSPLGQVATKPVGGADVPPVSAPPTRKGRGKTTYREAGISGPVEVEAKP